MLTKEEQEFLVYWKENRLRRKKVFRQLAIGLPFASVLVIAIFVNFFSNWYKKAEMVRNQQVQSNSSLIIVLLIAAILIVVFIAIFSVRMNWEKHEQRYRELGGD